MTLKNGLSGQVLKERCLQLESDDLACGASAPEARKQLSRLLGLFDQEGRGFTMYSLRRGGATALFAIATRSLLCNRDAEVEQK